MRKLVIPAVHVETLRDHLLQDDGLERFAFVFCTRSGDDRLLAADVVPVPDEQMKIQRETACRPDHDFEREQLQTGLSRGYQVLLAHSHAFSDTAGFSGRDVEAMADYTDWLTPLYPDAEIAFGVVGRREIEAAIYDPLTDQMRDLPVSVIGDWHLDSPLSVDHDTYNVNEDLFDRAIRFLGEEGQQRIAATTVGVVGVGGLGCELATTLARLGVQKLVLFDPDTVEPSNLNRLRGVSTYDIGRPKVTVIAQQLHESGLDITVEAIPERVEEASEALFQCDVIFGTADRVTTRSYVNQFAVQHLRYCIDAGVIIRTADDAVTAIEGVVQLVAPGATACYGCLDRADPDRARLEQLSDEELAADVDAGYIDAADLDPQPAVITLNQTIAGLAAAIFARLAAGYDTPSDMVRYEELGTTLQALATQQDVSCPICGADGILGQGDRDLTDEELAEPAPGLDLDLDVAVDGGDVADTGPRFPLVHRIAALVREGRP